MATSETSICNQALGIIGAKRINDFSDTTDEKPQAIQCRLHYEPTRDALQRFHFFRFTRDRVVLVQDTTDPAFEWDNQFILPNNFLRFRSIFEEDGVTARNRRHAIEGQRLLTNLSIVSLRYIKKVTDPTEFDPLFVKALVLFLADQFIGPLAGGDKRIQDKIDRGLKVLVPKVQAVDDDETDVGGRSDWLLARFGGIGSITGEERFW